MRNLFPSKSRELPVFPAVLGNTSISRLLPTLRRAVVSYWRKYVHEVLVNRLGGLSLPRKSVVRLTDPPDMTLDVYRGRKTTIQQQQQVQFIFHSGCYEITGKMGQFNRCIAQYMLDGGSLQLNNENVRQNKMQHKKSAWSHYFLSLMPHHDNEKSQLNEHFLEINIHSGTSRFFGATRGKNT